MLAQVHVRDFKGSPSMELLMHRGGASAADFLLETLRKRVAPTAHRGRDPERWRHRRRVRRRAVADEGPYQRGACGAARAHHRKAALLQEGSPR